MWVAPSAPTMPRAVDGEHDGKVLQRDVVDQLVVRALEERRVDGDDGFHSVAREPRRERHRVLLGDADVEVARRIFLREAHEARAFAHRRRDRHEAVVARRHVAQPVAEDLRVGGPGRRFRREPDGRIEFRDAVIEDRIVLRTGVAVALPGDHVQQLGPLQRLDVAERARQRVDIVAVDRADVVEAEFLEQRAGQHHALHVLFPALRELLDRRDLRQHFLAAPSHRVVEARRQHAREVAVERAHRLRDRHLVVVQHDEQIGAGGARIVQRLERHPGAHRSIADHRDHAALLAAALCGDRHPERRRNRRRRMRRAERVVFALRAARKPGRPVRHAQPAHPRAPAGQDLVRIGLVPDVPDDPVVRGVEHVMQRDRELDRAEVGRQVASRLRHRRHQKCPQFAREFGKLRAVEAAQRGGIVDRVEKRVHVC